MPDLDRPPAPRPLDPPMVPFAIGGTVVWAVLGLALLPWRESLAVDGHTWWLWTCLAGVLFGLAGIPLMIRHDAARRERRAAAAGTRGPGGTAGRDGTPGRDGTQSDGAPVNGGPTSRSAPS